MSDSSAPLERLFGRSPRWFRQIVFPISLILVTAPSAIVLWHVNVALDGSLQALGAEIAREGLFVTLYSIWRPVFFGTSAGWTIIGFFALSQLALMRLVPGPDFHGPVTPEGNVPVYRANGLVCFALTMGLFYAAAGPLGLISPAIVYDHFGGILGALNIFSLVFCLGLYLKGRFAPSSTDSGLSGNPIFDYYWGTELYPRVLGFDVKMFTNCRFGLMAWPIIIWSFAAKQQELTGLSDSMAVAVGIQMVYLAKFFWWETGYLRSLDIMHDRAGYYICWGCLVWVPAFYTSPTLFLVNHPNHLGLAVAIPLFVAGVASVVINYLADAQRQRVRATGGECKIWGRTPDTIVARYKTESGEAKENLLLVSGWWGISRHFHYLPELLAALCWSLPALFGSVMPYLYVTFLGILLIHRALRDDERCANKYGADWNTYRSRVRYKIIPGLF